MNLVVRANFCNLTDSAGRPIFSSCLAAQTPEMQAEWIEREREAGGTHYVFSIQAGYTDYPPEINFYLEGRMAEWLATLDRVLAAGLVPVVFLHTGGTYPGAAYFRGVLAEIPRSYYDRCIWASAWEPVKGHWTSRQFRDGSLVVRGALGPSPVMACHLSPGRLSFSSNPVEADDPWQGDEMACWREGWGADGHPFSVFLYQSYVAETPFDPSEEESWGERAKEVADRVLGLPGAPDWFHGIKRPVLVWFEATAYTFIRGQSTSEWARSVAADAQSLGYQGFGNGLPGDPSSPNPPPQGGTMQPYNEDLVFQTNEKVKALYAEANREVDEQYPVWIARTVYDYCAGMSWASSEAKHLRECREALGLPVPLPPSPEARTGIVRLSGRSMTDDGGAYLALGSTYFPLLPLIRTEPGRAEDNIRWLAHRGTQFTRTFCDVNGPTWQDRSISFDDPDWLPLARAAVDMADRNGIRIGWTLFAGPPSAHPSSWYRMATQAFVGLVAERPELAQYAEVRNEDQGPDDSTARDCAGIIRNYLPQLPVAVCGTPEAALPSIYSGSGANCATIHWDRAYQERGWRPVRQPWGYYELSGMPNAHIDNEPIGIDSSVASEYDPNHLAGAAITAWLTGECAYVFHTGAGIRAGGAADLARNPPRKPNVWEQPTMEDALSLMTGAKALLPADLPNWQRHGHTWPSHPLEIQTEVGDKVENQGAPGCNRCYAATSGDRAVVFVSGIRGTFIAASKGGPFAVYRPDGRTWVQTIVNSHFDLREAEGSTALLIRG
jgi:hypothetical protein